MSEEYEKAPAEVAKEIIRLAELQLQAMLTLTVGANQRAATLAGIFTTATVATLAAVAAAIDKKIGIDVVSGGIICAIFLFSGSICCVASLWPMDFHIAGSQPKNWLTTEVFHGSLSETLLYQAENYQERIEVNMRVNRVCGSFLKIGAALACAAPICGAIAWIGARYFFVCSGFG